MKQGRKETRQYGREEPEWTSSRRWPASPLVEAGRRVQEFSGWLLLPGWPLGLQGLPASQMFQEAEAVALGLVPWGPGASGEEILSSLPARESPAPQLRGRCTNRKPGGEGGGTDTAASWVGRKRPWPLPLDTQGPSPVLLETCP